jgi:RND family efflux transporter MFP subunit
LSHDLHGASGAAAAELGVAMNGYVRRLLQGTLVVAGSAFLAGCGENQYIPPPPPQVTVVNPLQQEITRYFETTGNTVAMNSAPLVARVQGYLQQVQYKDGAYVKKDTPLFVIEPEPYKLKYESAQAAQSGAEANLKKLEADYNRQVDLANRQVSAQVTLDQALAARDSGRATLTQSQTDTQTAAINLGYTEVKAPFDGYVTARQVSVGQLVGADSPTQLATIVQTDPIFVNFNISEKDALQARAALAEKGETVADMVGKLPIEVGLQTEEGFPHKGVLEYVAPTVNQSTGTMQVRGIFQNPNRTLLPGYFVRVRVPMSKEPSALLVPDIALGADQSGRYVLVIGADNIVEQRKVTVGPLVGDLRVIDLGLKPDDRIIVGGQLRAIPGQKVDPQLRSASASAK